MVSGIETPFLGFGRVLHKIGLCVTWGMVSGLCFCDTREDSYNVHRVAYFAMPSQKVLFPTAMSGDMHEL